MSQADNALITKIKSMHAHHLKSIDYEQLVKKRHIKDVYLYLKKHDAYADILKNVSEQTINRARLEGLIKRNQFNALIKIYKFIELNDKAFYKLSIIRMEHEVILAVIRGFISNDTYDVVEQIPTYLDRYSDIDFEALVNSTNLASMIHVLRKTRYHSMLEIYQNLNNDDIRYYEFEAIFENDYYKLAFETVNEYYRGSLKKQLENTFYARIEMENMIKVYRLKKYYNIASNDIKSIIVPSTLEIERKLDKIIAINDPDIIFESIIEKGDVTYIADSNQVYLEYYSDRLRHRVAKKLMYFSPHAPAVFLAYSLFSEIEFENLTHIIEGIRYQIPVTEIQSMLIY